MREYTVIFCPYGETGSPMIDYANAATPELAELAVLEKAARAADRDVADYDTIAIFEGSLREARYEER